MTVKFIDSIQSTQEFLINGVKDGSVKPPFMIVAAMQTHGVGSRANEWEGFGGNLFLSFCIDSSDLPDDISPNSLSIYFAMLLRELLRDRGSRVWIKWPNDFYIDELKIGGAITSKIGEIYICGIGLNLVKAPKNAGVLDIDLSVLSIVESYKEILQQRISWKEIFTKFSSDFERSRVFFTHNLNEKISLNDAVLLDDGSISVDGERIFSMR